MYALGLHISIEDESRVSIDEPLVAIVPRGVVDDNIHDMGLAVGVWVA